MKKRISLLLVFSLLFVSTGLPVFGETKPAIASSSTAKLPVSVNPETQLEFTPGSKAQVASIGKPANLPIPNGFRVTVLGSGLPNLNLDKGGPSYLVQYKDKMFLVDCGYQAMSNLMEVGIQPKTVTNMLFTHQHADHNADFWTFFVGGWDNMGRKSLNLVGPSVKDLYDLTIGWFKTDIDYRVNVNKASTDGLITAVNIIDLKNVTETFELDGVKISAMQVPHSTTAYAYKFEADGHSVVVSGDLTFDAAFTSFAKGADILVMDALMASDFSDMPKERAVILKKNLAKSHITNEEIAKIASEAAPKNLVLVHWSGKLTLSNSVKLYREAGFKGNVIKAVDGTVVSL